MSHLSVCAARCCWDISWTASPLSVLRQPHLQQGSGVHSSTRGTRVQGSGNSSHNDGDSETASRSDDDYVQTAGGLEPDGPMTGRAHPQPGRAVSFGGKAGSAAANGIATGASMDALTAELYKGSGTASVVPAMAGDPSPPLPALPQNSLMPPLPPLARQPVTITSSFAVSVGGGNRSVAARGQPRAAVIGQNRSANGRGKKPHLKVQVSAACLYIAAPGFLCRSSLLLAA